MQEISATSQKLLILSRLSRRLRQGVDLDQLLQESADYISQAMEAARVTIYLLDKKRGELWSKVAHLDEIAEIRLKLGQGVAGSVAKNGEAINIPASYQDERFYSGIDAQTGFRTLSQLCAPIYDNGGEILGVVQVLNKKGGIFTLEDEQFLEVLCAQFAILIEHTSLYQLMKATRQKNTRTFPLKSRYNNIIGNSTAMEKVFSMIAKIAPTPVTVMIRGESGTGKEMIARTIHLNSPRRDRPFVKIDCTTLPEALLENELFGHEKGAYTGANQKVVGKLEAAKDGTLFIDEIGDLPLTMQGKLLRILQDREYEPLGTTHTMQVQSRILTATNQNLEKLVWQKKFRNDLYFRIKIAQIRLPTLQQRGKKDIVALAEYFLDKFSRCYEHDSHCFSPESLEYMLQYSWPGNVRELENWVESVVVFAENQVIKKKDLPPLDFLCRAEPGTMLEEKIPMSFCEEITALPHEAGLVSLKVMEKKHIAHVLVSSGGNKSKAARILQIGRNTLLRKMEEYGIESKKK